MLVHTMVIKSKKGPKPEYHSKILMVTSLAS